MMTTSFDPSTYQGPPRSKVLLAMPCYDWKIDCECVGGLLQCLPFFDRPLFFKGMSDVALARNELCHVFVEKTDYDWLMMIDSDTTFTVQDWALLWEGPELVVCAEYARKIVGEPPVKFGLGFTRVHRSVFEKIKALDTEDGQERAQRFYHKREIYVNYFPNGVTSEGRVVREDAGFFMLVSLTEVSARLEQRTRLGHVGPMKFGYPDQVEGYHIVTPEEAAAAPPTALPSGPLPAGPLLPESAHAQVSDAKADDRQVPPI